MNQGPPDRPNPGTPVAQIQAPGAPQKHKPVTRINVLGPSWGPLGRSWGPLGGLLGPPGAAGGGPGTILEPSWVSWGSLGGLLGLPGAAQGGPGTVFGAVLGLYWALPGPLSAGRVLPWAPLWASWGILGPSWGHLEAILNVLRHKSVNCLKMQPLPHKMPILGSKMEPSWAQRGPSWGQDGSRRRSWSDHLVEKAIIT